MYFEAGSCGDAKDYSKFVKRIPTLGKHLDCARVVLQELLETRVASVGDDDRPTHAYNQLGERIFYLGDKSRADAADRLEMPCWVPKVHLLPAEAATEEVQTRGQVWIAEWNAGEVGCLWSVELWPRGKVVASKHAVGSKVKPVRGGVDPRAPVDVGRRNKENLALRPLPEGGIITRQN